MHDKAGWVDCPNDRCSRRSPSGCQSPDEERSRTATEDRNISPYVGCTERAR
eukprot:XP_001709562.1 Hypothetical protein GL50803_38142 [Giardia lamblia ATCC 50803]